ncbi:FAD-binding oxidoreductase [Anaerolineae bacterium CFX7]|nr:FAD-binding oxidoreductase [Anaerolineae bacterium CFX7]
MSEQAHIVICGAGIAGVSAAYHLAVRHGAQKIVLVEERAPLTLTSDKSTECYRNWWPGPGDAMVKFMNRSIDILEALARESDNVFHMSRRGYLYATADPKRIDDLKRAGAEAAELGAGALRVHPGPDAYEPLTPEGFENKPDGADLILDPALIQKHFPYLDQKVCAVLHARRCGYFSAQTYGMYMLERAREHGVRLVNARVEKIDTTGGRVRAVHLSNGAIVETDVVVNAAGPFVNDIARMMNLELPIYSELHTKIILRDDLGVTPRDTPLLVWLDPQYLPWSDEERELFAEEAETRWLLEKLPSGVHGRSEGRAGSPYFLLQWTIHLDPVAPTYPIPLDPQFPEITLRALATMLPGLKKYFGRLPSLVMDGGYYTKTPENRPLIGPLPLEGAYIIGALSGFGMMSSAAAGALLAAHVTGAKLPDYAPAFLLSRYDDPAYQKLLAQWNQNGQI